MFYLTDLLTKAGFTIEQQTDEQTVAHHDCGRIMVWHTPDPNGSEQAYPKFDQAANERTFEEYDDVGLRNLIAKVQQQLTAKPGQLLTHHQRPDGNFKMDVLLPGDPSTLLSFNIYPNGL